MIVKFKTGGAHLGLGYVPGEVVELKENIQVSLLAHRIVNGQVRGMVPKNTTITLEKLIQDGVVVQSNDAELKAWNKKVQEQTAMYSGAKVTA